MVLENPGDSVAPRVNANAESHDHHDETNPPVPPKIAVPDTPTPSPKQHEITVNIKRDKIDIRTLRLEGFGLFVLVLYTIFTGLMYSANRDAANAAVSAANTASWALQDARDNFAAEHRPIIGLTDNIGTAKIFKNPNKPTEGQIIWTWHYTNYGKNPPKDMRFRQYFKFANNPPILSYGETGDDIGAPTPPGKNDLATVVSEPMPIATAMDLIKKGNVRMLVQMEYGDASTSTHYQTGICLWRNNTGAIVYCDGNYIR